MAELIYLVSFVTLFYMIAAVCTMFKIDPTKLFKIN